MRGRLGHSGYWERGIPIVALWKWASAMPPQAGAPWFVKKKRGIVRELIFSYSAWFVCFIRVFHNGAILQGYLGF